MAGEIPVTVTGNLTGDPDLRYTSNGEPVLNFTLASNTFYKNQQSGQWENGDTTFFRVTAWKQLAEHASETLSKGTKVVVTGRFKTQTYTTDAGEQRSSLALNADEIGVALSKYVAQLQVPQAKHNPQTQGFASTQQTAPWNQQQSSQADPWGGQQQEAPF